MDAGRSTRAPAGQRRVSRRAVLLTGGAAVVAGGAAGVAIATVRPLPTTHAPPAPAALTSALAAEEALLAQVQAVRSAPNGSGPALRPVLTTIENDHRAHRTALQAALAGYRAPQAATAWSPARPCPARPRRAGRAHRYRVRPAFLPPNERAATAGAGRAAELTGRDATLLASIAACEASHATWLSAVAT